MTIHKANRVEIRDEGASQGFARVVDFTGASVVASVSGDTATIAITGASFANPTALVGLTAVNGSAATAMRSDAAPALDQGIVPNWTANHTWLDNAEVRLGTSGDLELLHDGTNSIIRNNTGNLAVSSPSPVTYLANTDVIIGHNAPILSDTSLELAGNSGNAGNMTTSRFTASADSTHWQFLKSRNATLGAHTIVQADDFLGSIIVYGSNGSNWVNAAQIRFVCDGTPGTFDMPGRIAFFTTPDNNSVLSEKLRISSEGGFGLGGANFGTAGQVLTSNGNVTPSWATPTGGSATITQTTVTLPAPAKQNHRGITVTDAGISGSSKIMLSLAGVAETAVNSSDTIDMLDMKGVPGAGSFEFQASFKDPISGPLTVNYMFG